MQNTGKSVRALVWLLALAAIAAVSAPGARAQGSRKDDIVLSANGTPVAGATIRVCTSAGAGQPCNPLASIYSDLGLTMPLPNPTTADANGNYFFYAAPGRYEIEISGPGLVTKQTPNVILPADPSGSGGVSWPLVTSTSNPATAGQLRFANSDLFEWRNFGNTANLSLGVNTSNQLVFNGAPVGGVPGGSTTELQYNNGGTTGGTDLLAWDNVNNALNVGTPVADAPDDYFPAFGAGGYPALPAALFQSYQNNPATALVGHGDGIYNNMPTANIMGANSQTSLGSATLFIFNGNEIPASTTMTNGANGIFINLLTDFTASGE